METVQNLVKINMHNFYWQKDIIEKEVTQESYFRLQHFYTEINVGETKLTFISIIRINFLHLLHSWNISECN